MVPLDPVLVVDDNLMNLELTATMLEACGFPHVLKQDGYSAVESFSDNNYCAVLMDCQMAGMDGLEATAAMRTMEVANPNRTRTPIIALTANAILGDRDKCLAVGMDEYLSKPIKLQQLRDTLIEWAPQLERISQGKLANEAGGAEDGDGPTIETEQFDGVESVRALARSLGKGDDFVKILIKLFLEESAPLHDAITTAVRERDGAALFQAAHSLKSCANNVGAERLARLCAKLEIAGQKNIFDAVADLFVNYEKHYELTNSKLCSFLEASDG